VESPESWNLLTASLSVCDLEKPEATWIFLTAQGLVRGNPADREVFFNVVKEEWDRGPIMGPSIASRVAGKLTCGNIVLSTGETPDPWGRIAKDRWQLRMGGGRSSRIDEDSRMN
jgi:hypothetical protein